MVIATPRFKRKQELDEQYITVHCRNAEHRPERDLHSTVQCSPSIIQMAKCQHFMICTIMLTT